MAIELSRHQEFALVRINRPDALNALSFALVDDLEAAFDEVAGWPARALLIIGAGDRAFCAGADIAELVGRSLAQARRGAERGQGVFQRLDRLPVASVAIINGYAFGGGLELATACTFRLAVAGAKLGTPEIRLGLIPGYGATQRLPRIIGEAHALDMVMTGRTVAADEALAMGLVHRIVDGDPLAAGVGFARTFSAFSLPVLGFARDAVQRALDVPLNEGLRIEADLSALAFQTRDAREGMRAFLEKRPPAFEDR